MSLGISARDLLIAKRNQLEQCKICLKKEDRDRGRKGRLVVDRFGQIVTGFICRKCKMACKIFNTVEILKRALDNLENPSPIEIQFSGEIGLKVSFTKSKYSTDDLREALRKDDLKTLRAKARYFASKQRISEDAAMSALRRQKVKDSKVSVEEAQEEVPHL